MTAAPFYLILFDAHGLLFQASQGIDGVGIVLEFHTEDLPVVQNLISGKAAHACGKISIGDRLVCVGSQSTENKSFNQIRDLIVGPVGSKVTLRFRGASGEYECHDLLRGSIDDIAKNTKTEPSQQVWR